MRIDRRRKSEKSDEFVNRYRYRTGVEATMSEYNTLTGVKQLRVRGLKAVRFSAILKAIGVNIFRATTVRRALMPSSDRFSSLILCLMSKIHHLAARLGSIIKRHMKYLPDNILCYNIKPVFAS